MKNKLSILLMLAVLKLVAQDFSEQIAVPLSSPGKQGVLEVGLVKGDIVVTAYEGDEVVIKATSGYSTDKNDDCASCDDDHDRDQNRPVPDGMKRISSNPIELSASEKNNMVEIETNSWSTRINLDIKVPSNFDLNVSTVNGRVETSGINGVHEISSVNGPIEMTNVGGSILSNTVNGDIIVTFTTLNSKQPMSFVTLNGDVDITFPNSTKAIAKMRTDRGEIFTDFDMKIDRSKPEVKTDGDEYKVSLNSWVYGTINGGGPEYTFKSMQGDIIIRRK
ncbi:MAG: DUF4097 family beta strand repeat-containing protein [Bacteroidota bacterium]